MGDSTLSKQSWPNVARPSLYSEELADEICEAIALNTKGLEHICNERADFPEASVVRRWILKKPEFCTKYALAKEQQMDLMGGEILTISDEEPVSILTFGENGTKECVDGAGIQRNRLRVDTRKWLMSKLAPKKYGERNNLSLSNPDGSPIQFTTKSILEE